MHKKKILIIALIVIYSTITICIKIKNNDSVYYDKDFPVIKTSNDFANVLYNKVNHKHTTNLEELINRSNIILVVKFIDYEQPYNDKTFANLKIQKVLKGTGLKKGDSIKMFDDIGFGQLDSEEGLKNYTYVHSVYYPMDNNKEYIVFLNRDKLHDGYYKQSTKFYSRYVIGEELNCFCEEFFNLPNEKCDTFEIDYIEYTNEKKYEEMYKLIFDYRKKINIQIKEKYIKGAENR